MGFLVYEYTDKIKILCFYVMLISSYKSLLYTFAILNANIIMKRNLEETVEGQLPENVDVKKFLVQMVKQRARYPPEPSQLIGRKIAWNKMFQSLELARKNRVVNSKSIHGQSRELFRIQPWSVTQLP